MAIFVTKSFLPPIQEYNQKVAEIFTRDVLTNQGPMLRVFAAACPVSEDIARRIACLPLYPDLPDTDVARICQIIKNNL